MFVSIGLLKRQERKIMLIRFPASVISLFLLTLPAMAEIKFYPLFSDNAVLQRDKPIVIWGTADPGEDITPVIEGPDAPKFGKTIFANGDRSWRITLPPLKAGGPYSI